MPGMSGDAVARRAGWVALWLAVAALCGLVTWFAIGYAVRQAEGDPLAPARTSAQGTPGGGSAPSPPTSRPATTSSGPHASSQLTARIAAQATDGGTVVTACTGARIELRSVTPRDGWGFSTQRSDGAVTVTLREVGDDEPEDDSGEHRLRVTATCVGGRPAYQVD